MGIWSGSKGINKSTELPLQRTYCFAECCLIQVQIWKDELQQLYQAHSVIFKWQVEKEKVALSVVWDSKKQLIKAAMELIGILRTV